MGCGAHLSALRRTTAACFDIGDAMTIDAIAADVSRHGVTEAPCVRATGQVLAGLVPSVRSARSSATRWRLGAPSRSIPATSTVPQARLTGPRSPSSTATIGLPRWPGAPRMARGCSSNRTSCWPRRESVNAWISGSHSHRFPARWRRWRRSASSTASTSAIAVFSPGWSSAPRRWACAQSP
ncbi:hypothetical protein [Nanchangia anserum]|uniref:hypothetical protein n=1 Tax=Nanchangia anserum TaxID=2692125 RepID=UPI001D102F1D